MGTDTPMARSLLCSKAHPDLLRIGGPGHPTKIPKKLVDTIADSDASSIIIEGLDQKNFEHFVSTYGVQFTEIQLSRCRTIADFSPLEKLPQIKYLAIRHNIRASALWNIRANPKLTHLELSGLNKIRGIDALADGLQANTTLQDLVLGSDLRPLSEEALGAFKA